MHHSSSSTQIKDKRTKEGGIGGECGQSASWPPTPPLPQSFYPLPSTLSHGWFPLGNPPTTSKKKQKKTWLPSSVWHWHREGAGGTQTATQMGNGQRRDASPHLLLAGTGLGLDNYTHTYTHAQMCIWFRIISLSDFPAYRLECTWKYSLKLLYMLIYLHVMHFFRHAVFLPHTAALPVTHRCLHAYLQLFVNMCSLDISLHIHHDKHT